jgi:hypothetical protein
LCGRNQASRGGDHCSPTARAAWRQKVHRPIDRTATSSQSQSAATAVFAHEWLCNLEALVGRRVRPAVCH